MRMARIVLTWKCLLFLPLVGFVLGCGDQSGSARVPTKEESKKIAEEMKNSMREFGKARKEAARQK